MIELLVHISDDQAAKLEQVSHQRQITREQVVEQAVTQYLEPEHLEGESKSQPLDSFGTMPHLEDGLVFQERMRREWEPERLPTWEDAVGVLKDFPEDGLAFQERMRKEWDRDA